MTNSRKLTALQWEVLLSQRGLVKISPTNPRTITLTEKGWDALEHRPDIKEKAG